MPCETCKESYLDSYDVTVDKIRQTQPDLSAHDVRVFAAQKFRPVFHEMKAGEAVEDSGEREYENGEFTLTTDGRIYYPRTDNFAEDFHNNQIRLSEMRRDFNKYSATDHQTTLLVQQAFASGATVVKTSYARDGEDNRDVLTFRYNPVTKKGKIEIIDTATGGKLHSFETIKQIARSQDTNLIETRVSDRVFILTDRMVISIPPSRHDVSHKDDRSMRVDVNTEYIHRPMTDKESSRIHDKPLSNGPKQDVDIAVRISDSAWRTVKNTLSDTQKGTKQTVSFLGDDEQQRDAKRRILVLPVAEQIRRLFHADKKVDKDETRDRHQKETRRERLTLVKIREKPANIIEVINKEHTEMQRTVRALAIVAETRVAIGAVPFLIGTLAKEQPKAMKAVEKSVIRHERKMRKVEQQERITLAQIRKKPESLRKIMVKRHKEMKQTVRAAALAVEMKAAGAIPFLVATLAKEEPKAFKAVEKSIRRHRKRKWRIASGAVPAGRQEWRIRSRETLKKEKRHVKSIEKKRKSKARKDRVIGVEKRNKKEKRPNHGRNETLRTVRAERKHLRKVIEKKLLVGEKRPKRERGFKVTKEQQREKKILKMLEQKGVKGKEKVLWITLVQLTRRLRTIQTETKRAKKSSRAVERQERPREAGFFPRGKKESFVQHPVEPVRAEQKVMMQFAYAWVLFMILNNPKMQETQTRVVGGVKMEKSSPAEAVAPPWILLSIIWYLTAIREQGMAVANSSSLTPIQSGLILQRKKNHTKSNHRLQQGKRVTRFLYPVVNSLSRYGVIYYYQAPFKNLTSL